MKNDTFFEDVNQLLDALEKIDNPKYPEIKNLAEKIRKEINQQWPN